MKAYVVVWHEDNASGVPVHVMGTSEIFFDKAEAKKWINSCVEEDKYDAEDNECTLEVFDPPPNSDVDVITETVGGKAVFYAIKELFMR